MDDFSDFKIMEISDESQIPTREVLQPKQRGEVEKVAPSKIMADNFPKILDLAKEMLTIERRKTEIEGAVKQMEQIRLTLIAEADAYAKKIEAETKAVVERLTIIRYMMQDFYAANTGSMTSEDFRAVITEIVQQMNK